jgi:prophage antirepressor-like protein
MTRAIPKSCDCCNQIFFAQHNAARYCSLNCKQTAYYRRRKVRDNVQLTAIAPQVVQPEILDDPDELPAAWREAEPEPAAAALAPFAYEGRQVRVVTDEQGMPWFVAADVCAVLGVGNSRQALTRLDDDEKGVISSDTLGGTQSLSTVNESGLYSLILGSRKPEARAFKRWVTHDVLPAIRRTGSYSTPATASRATLPAGPLVHSPGILVLARSKREAFQLWHDAVQDTVRSALTQQLSTKHRTDSGVRAMDLPVDWHPVY